MWVEEEHADVTLADGAFRLMVGSLTEGGVHEGVFTVDELWLTLTIDGGPLEAVRVELRPVAVDLGATGSAGGSAAVELIVLPVAGASPCQGRGGQASGDAGRCSPPHVEQVAVAQ